MKERFMNLAWVVMAVLLGTMVALSVYMLANTKPQAEACIKGVVMKQVGENLWAQPTLWPTYCATSAEKAN
jgi:hypothetical protein